MKYYAPDYFDSFACIAGECRHSCCIGWEIDIDEHSLEKYRSLSGETGRRLRENIGTDGEASFFRMRENGRCPFLNEEGLCDLILAEGEDILCQICADHPRFRNFFDDREEIGLGLSCEAAGRLIFGWKEKVGIRLIEDDGEGEEAAEEEEALREIRRALISIMQDRTIPVCERAEKMLLAAQIEAPELDFEHWAEYLMTLERLDEAWAGQLALLRDGRAADEELLEGEEWEIAFEQLMVCLLYRHLPAALQDGDCAGHIAFAYLSWQIIRQLVLIHAEAKGAAEIEDLVQTARMYSSEIEYSDVNTDEILDELYRMNE